MKREKYTEEQVAACVVAYLEGCGLDVYQEVATGRGPIADIVGVVTLPSGAKVCHVVEVKTGPSLALIEQVAGWIPWASYVSAAFVPTRGGGFEIAAKALGVGVMHVRPLAMKYDDGRHVTVRQRPEYRRIHGLMRTQSVERWLCDAQRTGDWASAGAQRGRRWTPYSETCRRLLAAVQSADDGLTMREAIDAIDHHYGTDATARSALMTWTRDGKVPGVRLDTTRKPYRLVLESTP